MLPLLKPDSTSAQSGFQIGDHVRTKVQLKCRTSPLIPLVDDNTIWLAPMQSTGVITGGPQSGSGYTWWKIKYDVGIEGWSAQGGTSGDYIEIYTPALSVADTFQYPLTGTWSPSQDFGGWNASWGGYHLAEDVLADAYTAVYASAAGQVRYTSTSISGYGSVIIIEHRLTNGSYVCTLYGHLSASKGLKVNVGDTVAKGQPIGYIGDSTENGGSVPHVHFGIRKGGYSTEGAYCGHWLYVGYSQSGTDCTHEQYRAMWYDPSGFLGPPTDTTKPTVNAFSVTPRSVTLGNPIFITFSVADTRDDGNNDTFTVRPSLSVLPASGLPGSTVVVTGSGWTPGAVVLDFGGTYWTTVTADASGQISQTVATPASQYPGVWQVRGFDIAGYSAATTFTVVTSALSVFPVRGPVGTAVTATVTNMLPNTCLAARFDGELVTTVPSCVQADGMGRATFGIVIPSTNAGVHHIVVTDGMISGEAHFTVIPTEGVQWCEMAYYDCTILNGIWGAAPDDVYAVGFFNCYETYGVIYHYNGASWGKMDIPTRDRLEDVWGASATDVFAVGYNYETLNSSILRYDGTTWIKMESPEKVILNAIWGSSASDVFAVGTNSETCYPAILHYDGTIWREWTCPILDTNNLWDVWGTASDNVYAVGDYGAILHYNGISWSVVVPPEIGVGSLFAIWGSSPTDIYAVGCHNNNIRHYDGTSWRHVGEFTHDYCFYGIWGSSPNDIFVVGHDYSTSGSAILHYDGKGWTDIGDVLRATSPMGVWGSSRDVYFAVTEDGYILQYCGYAADTTPPSAVIDLTAVGVSRDSITLSWTAQGDDGNLGTASAYDIRYSTSGITEANWNSSIQCSGEPAPQLSGNNQSFSVSGVSPANKYYFALKTADEASNWSDLSNIADGIGLAVYYAPVIYQDTDNSDTDADYITKFNFDGEDNWSGTDNWDNQDDGYELLPYVYYSIVETNTHFFICYAVYHPRDWTDLAHSWDFEHENDMEAILAVVKKDGTEHGEFLGMVTVAHLDFFSFIAQGSGIIGGQEDLDGEIYVSFATADPLGHNIGEHPRIYIEPRGHGIFGSTGTFVGLGGTASIGHWERDGFPGGDGITYFPGDIPREPTQGDTWTHYKLISIDELWGKRTEFGADKPYQRYGEFNGDCSDGCGSGIKICDEDAANPPWGLDDVNDGWKTYVPDVGYIVTEPIRRGEIFTDPAKLVDCYFIGLGDDFDREYVYNPYGESTLIVMATCPVDLTLEDPDGLTVSKYSSTIPDAVYIEADLNGDDDTDDIIIIPNRKEGFYMVSVFPEAGASPTDTYTLEVSADATTTVIAQDQTISKIPEQPYIVESTESGINAAPIADANGPYIGAKGNSITFDSTGSYDPESSALSYGWDFGDGCTGTGASPTHSYPAPGLYNTVLTVTDDEGAQGSASTLVVVYDPEGGFVTGGGWIDSPSGAYTPDLWLIGKATFGFVSKYKKGATVPTGVTEFQFKVADLNFHSESYQWLVIAGSKAMYKGVGTINGGGNYGFMLSAIDAGLTAPKDDVDTFRIKIWDKDNGDTVVYDNQLGAAEDANPSTAIAGGSIVIHK